MSDLKSLGKFPCISCDSSDALNISETEDGKFMGHCFSCKKSFGNNKLAASDLGAELGAESTAVPVKKKSNREYNENKFDSESVLKQKVAYLRDNCSLSGHKWRGIRGEITKFYSIYTEFNQQTGKPSHRYYPNHRWDAERNKYVLKGIKKRTIDAEKSDKFKGGVGKVNNENAFVGQNKFPKGCAKTIIIAGGEEDMLAARQMLVDNCGSKYNPPAVVSPSCGEGSTVKQIKANYDYLNSFDEIVLMLDNDKAGIEATKECCRALPQGKVYTVELPENDVSDCLTKDKYKQFISCWINRKKWTPAEIYGSSQLYDMMLEYTDRDRVSLPPVLKKLEDKLGGGIVKPSIVNIISSSGAGKSTYIELMVKHWIFEDHKKIGKVGILPLEAQGGKYFNDLLSSHIKKKINLIKKKKDRKKFLKSDYVKEKAKELMFDENGEDRFYVMDGDGISTQGIEDIKKNIEYLIKVLGCKIIIVDPVQDLFDYLSTEEQAMFIGWQKTLSKQYNCVIVNISHIRKATSNQKSNAQGREIHEDDAHGISQLIKSASVNIIMWRNKDAEDEEERNTMHVKVSKSRDVGDTGYVGDYYYDNETHTIWDKEEWDNRFDDVPSVPANEIEEKYGDLLE